MKIEKVKIGIVKSNPNNPRVIKDDKFKKLVQSVKDFPQMLDIRPIVVNDDMIVLGGNMRLKACIEAGLKEVSIIKASDLTPEQQNEFIIKDNVGFGEWDWDILANEWDDEKLVEWGLDLPLGQQIDNLEDGEEILLEQAIQLKPKREYVVIMCDEENSDWDELKQVLELPMVKRGGFTKDKTNKGFIDTQRVINAKDIINALRSTK
jgi:ParB-like chromosome segregation protein Spo0J